jgi:curli biogenesis system outer membrane secretion channel CsgG
VRIGTPRCVDTKIAVALTAFTTQDSSRLRERHQACFFSGLRPRLTSYSKHGFQSRTSFPTPARSDWRFSEKLDGFNESEEDMKMSTFFRAAIACLVAVTVIPVHASAQGKIRIAIWDFENHAEQRWWFHSDLGPAARNQIDTAFSENPVLFERFSVIEREKLSMVMQEQGLSSSGALDQQTAAKVGQILGVKYIVTGGIDKFVINTTKGGFRGIGGKYTTAEAEISMRFIDTTTSERVIAVSAEDSVKKGGVFFKGASLSREDEWGIASEAIDKAAEKLVAEFAESKQMARLSPGGAMGGTEGKIIKVEGTKAWVNMGSMSGLKVGDSFEIVKVGEALVDPDTGQVLGTDETSTGQGQIVEVQDRFSIMTFTGAAQASDVVRKR